MRNEVRHILKQARSQRQGTLGEQAVRLARLAAALHAAQAAEQLVDTAQAKAPAALQEQHQ